MTTSEAALRSPSRRTHSWLCVRMASVRYPTSCEVPGPMLIAWEDLENLQETLATVISALNRARVDLLEAEFLQRVEAEVESERRWNKTPDTAAIEGRVRGLVERKGAYRRPDQTWKVHLQGGRYLEGEALDDIVRHPGMGKERATGLVVKFQCGEVWGEVRTTGYATKLDVSVYPSGNAQAEVAYENLRQWSERVRPSVWLANWSSWSSAMWLTWLCASTLGCMGVLGSGGDNGKLEVRKEAAKLLADGIAPAEQARAQELMLKLVGDIYETKPVPIQWGYYPWVVLGGLALCLLYSTVPGFRMSLSGTDRAPENGRWWARMLWISLPVFVVVEVGIAYMVNRWAGV